MPHIHTQAHEEKQRDLMPAAVAIDERHKDAQAEPDHKKTDDIAEPAILA